jgi:acetyl esterase
MVIAILALLVICSVLVLYINSIRNSPDGKMEIRTALALKFLKEYQGNDIFEVRDTFAKMIKGNYAKKLPITKVENFSIDIHTGSVPVRFYTNDEDKSKALIVFIHGGGWCIGNLNTHDQQCRRLVLSSGNPLLSIDYSLSPEVKFPHAINEVSSILQQLSEKKIDITADTTKLVVMGDSAGGNMSITSILNLIDKGIDISCIKCLIPVYPVTDCTEDKGGSYKDFQRGYILTRHLMDLFSDNYIPENHNRKDPLLSPLYSNDLDKLPPCFVITAGLDPLRDEGERFAQKLQSLGNAVELKRYKSVVHSFYGQIEFGTNGLSAIDDTARFIAKHVNN